MQHRNKFFFLCVLLAFAGNSRAQHIAQLTPPNITFRAIAIADSSHSMIVGDSAAIFTSTGGDSLRDWHPLPAPCDASHTFNGVTYYDTSRAVIITDGGLIFTTTDAGMDWVPSGAGITAQTLRAIIHTTKGSLIVVGDSGIILRSMDSGATWSKVLSNTAYNINAIAINSIGRGYFAGMHGLIGRTTDFGATWYSVTDTITNLGCNRAPINFRGVAINTGNAGIAVGDSGGIALTVNGASWQAVSATTFGYSHSDSLFYEPGFEKLSYSSVMYCGVPGVQWRLTGQNDLFMWMPEIGMAGGMDWEQLGWAGDADGGTDYIFMRTQCQAIWRGKTHTFVQIGGPYEIIYNSIGNLDPYYSCLIEPHVHLTGCPFLCVSIDSLGKGFATLTGGIFAVTSDNGLTWNIPGNSEDNNYKATDIYAIDSNNAFAVGWAGSLFRTTDGGGHWDSTQIDPNQERLHSIANPANNVFVVCGDFGTMLRSTDNAITWTPSSTPTTEYLESVAFSTPEIGVAAGTNGTLLRTTDQGVTWASVNNPLTGTNTSYRKLEAFPSGKYFATTDSNGLWISSDHGQNWSSVPNAPQTMGMTLYNERIGVIAESGWCSIPNDPVNDTARFAFTRDGFASKPVEFNIPIINNGRMAFHFLDSNSFLCFGSDGFVVKVDMSSGSARVTELSSPQVAPIQVFPNPSATHSTTIEYDLDHSGATTIELWNTLGEPVQTLFSGNEAAGHHARLLRINPELHGSFFVKVISSAEAITLPICVE